MAPIEKFSPQDVDYYKALVPAVDKIVDKTLTRTESVLGVNSGEDEESLEAYRIYRIGGNPEAYDRAVVLIGNDASRSRRLVDIGKPVRPHILIGDEVFIDNVKKELENPQTF